MPSEWLIYSDFSNTEGQIETFISSQFSRRKYTDAAQTPQLELGKGRGQTGLLGRRFVSHIAISAEHVPVVRVEQARRNIRAAFRTYRQRPLVFAYKEAKASQPFDKGRVSQI
jgi:hypothetical protein